MIAFAWRSISPGISAGDAVVERRVAVVDHVQFVEDVEAERVLRVVVHDGRSGADAARAEAGARPVRGRGVERNAPHHGVGSGKILGVAPPHEGERAGEGGVGRLLPVVFSGKGVVGMLGHGVVRKAGSRTNGTGGTAFLNAKGRTWQPALPKSSSCCCQRLENWKLRRAFARPYFLRSTTRESRVRKPPALSVGRSSGS